MRREAIVVGIDEYTAMPLAGCVRDAEEVAMCLEFPEYAYSVRLIENHEATRSRILRELNSAISDADDGTIGSSLIFYFAGHGQVLHGSSHLVTIDSEHFDPGLSLAQLGALMEGASRVFSSVIVILDSCHSGAASTWADSRPLSARDIERDLPSVNESRCILAACRPEQMAEELPLGQGGLFTRALTEGVMGAAVNFDGDVTLLALHDYIAGALNPAEQVPVFKGDVAGTVVLGSGFEPRKGRPLRRGQMAKLLARGQALVDEYYQLTRSELGDEAYRLEHGMRSCCKQLELLVTWFKETEIATPDVVRDQSWKVLAARVREFQGQATELAPGMKTTHGIVEEPLGNGGFGRVWRLKSSDRGDLAYKVYHGNELDDLIKVKRFRNGWQNMRTLDHPRIVKVHELTDAPFGFLMSAIPGLNFKSEYVDREDATLILRLMIEIAETVQHAHAAGVIHRDIKPENIILVRREMDGGLDPYLTDFDLAYHKTNKTLTVAGVGGVLNYAAPEQLRTSATAAAREETVDVYSLGQLMYFAIVGQDPTADFYNQNCESLTRFLSQWVEPRAASVLLESYAAAVQRDPIARPQSVSDLLESWRRAEAFILQSSGSDAVAEDSFCQTVAHQYVGVGLYRSSASTAEFDSLSGQISVQLRQAITSQSGLMRVEIELNSSAHAPVGSARTGEAGRRALNERLTRTFRDMPNVRRSAGNRGVFQTFLEVGNVPLTVDGVAQIMAVLTRAIGVIENAA